MYSVSTDYLSAMRKKVRKDSISGTLTLADGTAISINDENLVTGSMKLEKTLCGSEYRIGSFNLACLRFSFFIDNALGLDLTGAKTELEYELKVGDDTYETVPLGVFYADPVLSVRRKNILSITAYDAGAKADIAPSQALKNMTGTAAQLIIAACSECGISTDITASSLNSLPNSNIPVTAKDKQIQSCRDIIMWCSRLLCAYAVIGRDGKLMIIPAKYAVSDTDSSVIIADRTIREDERDSITVTDTRAYIKYLTAYKGSDIANYTSVYTPTDEQASPAAYALEMNPLLCEASENVCDAVNRSWLGYIDSFKQRGVKSVTYGDPALDIGDTVMFRGGDVDQRSGIIGIVTSFEWVYRGYQSLVCAAAECVGSIAPGNVVSNKYRPQSHKLIDAVSSSGGGSGGVGENLAPYSATAERFNDYDAITFGSTGPTGGSVSTVPYDHLEGYRNYSVGNGSVQDDYVVGNGANHISGQHNKAQSALGCTISGKDNTVSGSSGCDVSGNGNNVSGAHGTVAGGEGNTVTGNHHSVSGNGNEVSGIGDTVGGDSNVVTDVDSSNGYNRVGGRDNIVTNCFTADVIGHGMTVNDSDGATVRGVGDPNDHAAAGLVSGSPFSIAVMNGGKMINCQDSAMFGSSNSMTSSPYSMVFGDVNSLSGGGHNYCIGQSNEMTSSIYGFCFGLNNKIGRLHPGTVAMCFGYGAEIGTSDSPPSPYRTGAAFAFGSGNIFTIDYNGDIHAAGSYGTTGADYAEYFEWADGNPENEDRRGWLVSLEGDKIVPADGNGFLGIVSSAPSVVGNSAEFHWKGKYVTDAFGVPVTDDNGKPVISDDFDPERTYVPRSQRGEWAAIGLMGQLIVTDDGSCTVGGYCTADNGRARKWAAKTKARVIRRTDDSHVEVLLR